MYVCMYVYMYIIMNVHTQARLGRILLVRHLGTLGELAGFHCVCSFQEGFGFQISEIWWRSAKQSRQPSTPDLQCFASALRS